MDALVTPTTKSAVHDEPISPADVVAKGIMSQADWDACEAAAKALFVFGSRTAAARGLILVDTKYEFGGTRPRASAALRRDTGLVAPALSSYAAYSPRGRAREHRQGVPSPLVPRALRPLQGDAA